MERQSTNDGAGTPLSATGRAILGLLGSAPRTGYDIKSAVDGSIRFFWAASYGQIYPELKRLESAGLVRVASAEKGGRRRSVYEITAAGRDALQAWLASDAELTTEMRDEGLLRFFFSDLVDREEALANVRAMRAHHEAMVRRLREIEPKSIQARDAGRRFPYLTLMGGIELHEQRAAWCARMEKELS
ncbi:MAG TPA: PadR family transcriptional regulator [Thermoleophilaceae bacterium]|nr:PadR family transcriptional regulator [Thermoleophilaceae bacterium]